MSSSLSRFDAVSRRAFVTRTLALGALVAVPGLACSKSDKQTFTTSATGGTAGTTTAVASTESTAASAGASAAATGPTVAAATADAAGSFPAGGQVVVKFTYAAASGGQIHNPFIAVWIEDSSGALVKTVSLWYKARESKYLNELQRWASVETAFQSVGGSDQYDTVSGATRVAGDYAVMWDGTDAAGTPVALGDYFVCIEAAREKGPYELVRGPVTIAAAAATAALGDNGELTGASVDIVV